MDREKLKNRAREIADDLDSSTKGLLPEDELGAVSLYKALSESIGGVHNLETGNFPEEAKYIKELIKSEPFKKAMARIGKK